MNELQVFNNAHWTVSHRQDARYDGYLIISSQEAAAEISDLSDEALSSLGPTMKATEQLLMKVYSPCKVVFYKLGFSRGFNVHFHVAPMSGKLLREISNHPDYTNTPDGNDAILFLSREYCERTLTVDEAQKQWAAVLMLREAASHPW